MEKAQKIKKESEELDKCIKTNPDSRELKRAIAVKLSLQGWTYQAIAPILNVSLSFIGKWKTHTISLNENYTSNLSRPF